MASSFEVWVVASCAPDIDPLPSGTFSYHHQLDSTAAGWWLCSLLAIMQRKDERNVWDTSDVKRFDGFLIYHEVGSLSKVVEMRPAGTKAGSTRQNSWRNESVEVAELRYKVSKECCGEMTGRVVACWCGEGCGAWLLFPELLILQGSGLRACTLWEWELDVSTMFLFRCLRNF